MFNTSNLVAIRPEASAFAPANCRARNSAYPTPARRPMGTPANHADPHRGNGDQRDGVARKSGKHVGADLVLESFIRSLPGGKER